MKNILFLIPDLRFGGVENSLVNLVNSIDPKKNINITILMYEDRHDLLSKLSKSDLIKTKIIKTNKAVRCVINCFGKMLGKYGYFFKDSYFNKIKAALYIKNSVKKYDHIISYHASCTNNIIKFANPKSKDKMIMWYHGSRYSEKSFDDAMTCLFSKVIVVNDLCAEVICKHNPALTDKITSIENLVPYIEIIEKSKIGKDLFEKDCFNIVTCARIDWQKGIDTAVEACRILKEKISDFKWYLIGDAVDSKKEYENQIKELIKKYELEDTFILLGSKQNPFPYFAQCDLHVQPSHEESFGITIAEAQVCGAVIVATDTVGARHLIKNGETGIITDNNSDALAEGIYEMYNDNEKRNFISENVKKLDFEESNQKILNKFYDLIGVTTDRE